MTEAVNLTRISLDLDSLVSISERFLREYDLAGHEVSIAIVGDKRMERLNSQYRKKPGTTDVLSFEGEGEMLGEIILNYQQIKRQARELGDAPEKELVFILVHGLLHLLGRTDETEVKRKDMIDEARAFIAKLDK